MGRFATRAGAKSAVAKTVDRSVLSRLPFLIAVALMGAALGDALVEAISDTGVFGTHYFDHNHLSVVPTMIAGAILAVEIVASRCIKMCRDAHAGGRDWLVDVAAKISARSPAQDLPYVLALQLAALFLMESSEQLLMGGRLLGGTVWLGGPVLFSLTVHALIAAGCTWLIGRLMRGILTTFAALVGTALEFILVELTRGTSGRFCRWCNQTALHRAQSPHVRQTGERAPPPILLALT